MNERDWKLAQLVPDVMDSVCGLAHATLAVLKGHPHKARDAQRIELAKEVAQRFVDLTTGLSVASMEYHEGMEERALHAWAQRVVATIEKSPN